MTNAYKFQGVETTTIMHSDGELAGYYRGTDVARIKGNVIKLNTGGWFSKTTKTRMNQFANNFANGGFYVYQKKFNWFVVIRETQQEIAFSNNRIEFTI